MTFINYASKEINCKIVYYGPGLCGKTTNLQYIYNKTSPDAKGKMISLVGGLDIPGVARKRGPTIRSGSLAKQRTNVRRNKAWKIKGMRHVPVIGHLAPEVVSVIEADRAAILQVKYRLHVNHHGVEHGIVVLSRVGFAQGVRSFKRIAGRDVSAAQIVGRSLVGNDVRHNIPPNQFRHHFGDVAQESNRERSIRLVKKVQSFIEVAGHAIAKACLNPSLNPPGVHFHSQALAVVHGDRQGLGTPHAAKAGGDDQPAFQAAAEMLIGALGECFISALNDSL
jgi:hypothetical protein